MNAPSVTKVFRDGIAPDPRHHRCLRCGERISYPETGRPREYCGDACRQAGARLRRKHGWYWWKHQPWYAPWAAERVAWHEQWERDRPEREREAQAEREQAEAKREERRALLASMPPDVRRAFDEAEDQARRRSRQDTDLTILRMELETISLRHEELLRATGHQVRLVDMSRKIEKLLRSALYAENDDEAAAMFAGARRLRAAGEDLDEMLAGRDLFRKLIGDLGGERERIRREAACD